MMRGAVMIALAVVSLAGCERLGLGGGLRGQSGPVFDGQTFRGSAKAVERKDRQQFVATVSPVSRSLDGAIEAATYQGVQHCLKYYGTSDITWDVGPLTPKEALEIENDRLTFVGACAE